MKARIYGPNYQKIPASVVKKSGRKPKELFKPALCVLWVVPVVQNSHRRYSSCLDGFDPVELWVPYFLL